LLLRPYEPDDRDAVRRVHAAAFGGGTVAGPVPEAVLFDALLDDGDLIVPLSPVVEDGGEVVAHVACSGATVDAFDVVGLGPIGVLPARQGAGLGTALMHAVLDAADTLEFPLVALLGSPAYYGRFGFVPASSLGIQAPDPAWGDDFQARSLRAYRSEVRGPFRYAPAFAIVSSPP